MKKKQWPIRWLHTPIINKSNIKKKQRQQQQQKQFQSDANWQVNETLWIQWK